MVAFRKGTLMAQSAIMLSLLGRPTTAFIRPSVGPLVKACTPWQRSARVMVMPAEHLGLVKASSPRQERLRLLEDWLQAQGIEHDTVTLRGSTDDDAGMFARQDLKQGQVLFTIPDRLVLRPIPPSSLSGGGPLPFGGALSAQGMLALRILYELHLGSRSLLGPYLRSLPSSEEMHMPLLWSEEEAELLGDEDGGREDMTLSAWRAWVRGEGQIARELIKQQQEGKEDAGKEYDGLSFDMDDWLWARAIALSRAYLMDPANPWSLTLIPLVDMNNHEDNSTCAIVDSREAGSFSFMAVKPYQQGQQVMSSYGPLNAALKLFTWGYLEELVLAENGDGDGVHLPKQGYVQLTFDLTEDIIPALEDKKRVLLRYGGFMEEEEEGDAAMTPAASSSTKTTAGGGAGGRQGGLDDVSMEVMVTVRRANADTWKADVVIDNEGEIQRMKQALRVLLMDEEKLQQAGWTDEEVWSAGAYDGDRDMEEDVTAVMLQECQSLMQDVASRLVACQQRKDRAAQQQQVASSSSLPAATTTTTTSTAGQGSSHDLLRVHQHRLGLAELWLRGQLMALQALAEYLLKDIDE